MEAAALEAKTAGDLLAKSWNDLSPAERSLMNMIIEMESNDRFFIRRRGRMSSKNLVGIYGPIKGTIEAKILKKQHKRKKQIEEESDGDVKNIEFYIEAVARLHIYAADLEKRIQTMANVIEKKITAGASGDKLATLRKAQASLEDAKNKIGYYAEKLERQDPTINGLEKVEMELNKNAKIVKAHEEQMTSSPSTVGILRWLRKPDHVSTEYSRSSFSSFMETAVSLASSALQYGNNNVADNIYRDGRDDDGEGEKSFQEFHMPENKTSYEPHRWPVFVLPPPTDDKKPPKPKKEASAENPQAGAKTEAQAVISGSAEEPDDQNPHIN